LHYRNENDVYCNNDGPLDDNEGLDSSRWIASEFSNDKKFNEKNKC